MQKIECSWIIKNKIGITTSINHKSIVWDENPIITAANGKKKKTFKIFLGQSAFAQFKVWLNVLEYQEWEK
jgi:hypothetical protein